MNRLPSIQQIIEKQTGQAARIKTRHPVGGGCINDAERLDLEDGRRFFLKTNPSPLPGMFAREAEGLVALAGPRVIRVPAVIAWGDDGRAASSGDGGGETPFLLLECIETGRQGKDFFEDFGRGLALLHQRTQSARFGFDHDNYIGSTPQPNAWMGDWVGFWRERRLGFQLELARYGGLADAPMLRAGERMMERLDELIGEPAEPACLLHGDLWGGNFMTGESGEPVLIDPAAYYGRREADLAMTRLFGGFDARFYRAYEEVWPLAEGADLRQEIYKLYHLLNHLNLFGGGYYGSCMAILKRFA